LYHCGFFVCLFCFFLWQGHLKEDRGLLSRRTWEIWIEIFWSSIFSHQHPVQHGLFCVCVCMWGVVCERERERRERERERETFAQIFRLQYYKNISSCLSILSSSPW
jgi:hypothetical protein